MNACYKNEVQTVIIGFTAISKKEMGKTSVLDQSIGHLINSLNLMGSEIFFVGFTPDFTQE
jgi:rsbT co-antagonist protein RsbR